MRYKVLRGGVISVPITIFDKEYAGTIKIIGKIDAGNIDEYNLANPIINGKEKFKRIAIRREINEI